MKPVEPVTQGWQLKLHTLLTGKGIEKIPSYLIITALGSYHGQAHSCLIIR